MTKSTTGHRDERQVSEFVERFASTLVDAGIPRMPSRVFVALLASVGGRLTAAELAEQLQASPAAISGAVRYLTQVDLITRHREPGSRRDVYLVDDDVWFTVINGRLNAIMRWGDQLAVGIDAVGAATPAGARLAEMVAFFEFMRDEMPALMKRWHEQRGRN